VEAKLRAPAVLRAGDGPGPSAKKLRLVVLASGEVSSCSAAVDGASLGASSEATAAPAFDFEADGAPVISVSATVDGDAGIEALFLLRPSERAELPLAGDDAGVR
jgi:hypothetical protein